MRRILIITSTFFPDPQVAAIRMAQWCRHLPGHGWKPHVLCRSYGHACSAAELAAAVHPDVTVEYLEKAPFDGSGTGNGRALFRALLSRIVEVLGLNALVVPDTSVFFWRRQRAQVLKRVREIQPDVILTTSPPHAVHDLGLWLTAETGIPWVADFRDPYLMDARFRPKGMGRLRWGAHVRFQDAIYRRAWLITHAIPNLARWARRNYPEAGARMLTLTNGFPVELVNALKDRGPDRDRRRTILVAGTIQEQEQAELARAVAQLAAEGLDVQLKLVGKCPEGESELRSALGDRLLLTGYLSHAESIREIAQADVLVNFLDEFRSQTRLLSTKLIEYLASGLPVVCINPSRSDRLLLRRMGDVTILRRPRCEELEAALRKALEGCAPRDTASLEGFRAEFNWPRRVAQLAPALDRLVAFPPPAASFPGKVSGPPMATVVIPTRNRKHLLRQSILAALAQTVPVEVIVMDDGSTDGTVEMVRREFPQVRCCELGSSKGPAFQRNRGIEMAAAEIVFPIDDDSVFSNPNVVEETLADFDTPRVAAVGIPFLNPRLDWTRVQGATSPSGCYVAHAFVGAAHAVRRSVFVKLGGFREHFHYMGEEGDLCLRMLAAGYVTRLGRSSPVHHFESPRRNTALADFCGRRNDILFAWHNVPTPFLPLHLAGTTFNGLRTAATSGHFLVMLRGMLSGFAECLRRWGERAPVPSGIYRLHRRLKKLGPRELDEISRSLPPLAPEPAQATAIVPAAN